jgi:hypothetical protein
LAVGRLSKRTPHAKECFEISQEEFHSAFARYFKTQWFDACTITQEGKDQITDIVMAQACRAGSLVPFHKACLAGDKNFVQEIIDGGADPNVVDNNGATALFTLCAADKGDRALVQLLLVLITVPNYVRLISALFSL